MALIFHVMKIKQELFSKLTCCVYQVNFFCMKRPVQKALFQKLMFEKRCALVKNYQCHLLRKCIPHKPKYYVNSLERNKMKLSDIRVVKEEKIFRRKYSVDTVTDVATADFDCASL